jgi:hypothetical protein
MVLAYYDTPEADPVVLDNLTTALRPAPRRPDLEPVFSFNSQNLWAGLKGGTAPAPNGTLHLSQWEDLLRRVKVEGFD